MSWTHWTLGLAEHLAWPLLFALVFLVLRKRIFKILDNIREVKYGDITLKLAMDVDELEEKAENAGVLNENNSLYDERTNLLLQTVESSPVGAIVDTWKDVEIAVREFIYSKGHKEELDRLSPFLHMERIIRKHQLLDKSETEVYRYLRQIRNKAAHATGYIVSQDTAVSYIHIARDFIETLKLR